MNLTAAMHKATPLKAIVDYYGEGVLQGDGNLHNQNPLVLCSIHGEPPTHSIIEYRNI